MILMAEMINPIVNVHLPCPLLVKITPLTKYSTFTFLSQYVLTSGARIIDHVVVMKGLVLDNPSDHQTTNPTFDQSGYLFRMSSKIYVASFAGIVGKKLLMAEQMAC